MSKREAIKKPRKRRGKRYEVFIDRQDGELEYLTLSQLIDLAEAPPADISRDQLTELACRICLAFFRRASDPAALDYVLSRWARSPDKAKEYALYLNRFVTDEKHRPKIDKTFVDAAEQMLDFQWAWAALIARRMKKVSGDLLTLAVKYQADGDRHEVVRSLLTYIVCRHGSPARKKAIRDGYGGAPLLVQLATLHASEDFTSAEQAGLLTTAEAHGELQGLMCDAVRAAKKSNAAE